jgi:hypothetical protein
MMPVRRVLGLACLIAASTCLATGYLAFGLWIVLPVVLLVALVGLSAWREPFTWMPTLALAVNVCLAAAGLLSGAMPFLMILSATLGLAVWDLEMLERDLMNGTAIPEAARFEKKHYAILVLALLPGLLAAAASQVVRIQIPFIGMVILVILAFACLIQVWSLLMGKA